MENAGEYVIPWNLFDTVTDYPAHEKNLGDWHEFCNDVMKGSGTKVY